MLRRAIGAVVIALAALAPAFAQTAPRESIATVRQHTSWTPSEELVRVRAIVTLSDEPRRLLFVQDASGGMFVMPSSPVPALSGGEVVEVSGTAVTTRRGPTIVGATVTMTGKVPALPPQPLASLDPGLAARSWSVAFSRCADAIAIWRWGEASGCSTVVAAEHASCHCADHRENKTDAKADRIDRKESNEGKHHNRIPQT